MTIKVYPSKPRGSLRLPSSKSLSHRALFCAAMAHSSSIIHNLDISDDLSATIDFCRALGAEIFLDGATAHVTPADISKWGGTGGAGFPTGEISVSCRQSGTTLRFAIPAVLAAGKKAIFTGEGRLLDRPLESLEKLCVSQNWVYQKSQNELIVYGQLQPKNYTLEAVTSSQFVSGMMLALGSFRAESRVTFASSPSAPYIAMTVQMMSAFGCKALLDKGSALIGGGYEGQEITVEADWSHGALFAALGASLGDITLDGLNLDSSQGDRHMLTLLSHSGAGFGPSRRFSQSHLQGVTLDCTDYPDLAPAAAALGCFAQSPTTLVNTERLRAKESDRAAGIISMINTLGGRAELNTLSGQDKIIIHPLRPKGGRVAVDDHRMAMMAAFLACGAENPVIIDGAECVAKSYPAFWEDLKSLGVRLEVLA